VQLLKVEAANKAKAKVACEGHKLTNTFTFKYLGSIFAADGSHVHDVKRRCAMASSRCGDLTHVFNSKEIPLGLKLKIYRTAICSLMTYGSEAWHLSERTMASLNGCNSRCLSHITGNSAHAEASPRTRTFDLVGAIRQQRYRWLGHILRMSNNRFVKETVKVQFYMGIPGNIFMDAPKNLSFEQLEKLAEDRDKWRLGMPGLVQKKTLQEQESYELFQRNFQPTGPPRQHQGNASVSPTTSSQFTPTSPASPPLITFIMNAQPPLQPPQPGGIPPDLLQQLQAQFPDSPTTTATHAPAGTTYTTSFSYPPTPTITTNYNTAATPTTTTTPTISHPATAQQPSTPTTTPRPPKPPLLPTPATKPPQPRHPLLPPLLPTPTPTPLPPRQQREQSPPPPTPTSTPISPRQKREQLFNRLRLIRRKRFTRRRLHLQRDDVHFQDLCIIFNIFTLHINIVDVMRDCGLYRGY
jgi:hypothetical protein